MAPFSSVSVPFTRYIIPAVGWIALAAFIWLWGGHSYAVFVGAAAVVTVGAARLLPRSGLPIAVAAYLGLFAALAISHRWMLFGAFGLGVVMSHAVAFLIDVRRGVATTARPLRALLYVAQLPVAAAGPLMRYTEFEAQLARPNVTLGAFAYGIRRIVTGLIKAAAVGLPLANAASRIFAAPPRQLSAGAAWLGAVCYALEVYLVFSGLCDVGVGIGRVVGLRYPENFRRPYTADSVREFWRRWNVTLITWLRDYLSLPIAGHDDPTPRLYATIVAGFCIVGLWHHGGPTFLLFGVYSASWLALEAVWLRPRLERLPRAVRHAYVLLVVVIGWVLLRSPHVIEAFQYVGAMFGANAKPSLYAPRYADPWLWVAIAVGVFAAGPLVASVSRWRVSIDAATTSLLMMGAATGVFLWRGPAQLLHVIRGSRGPRTTISSAPRRGGGSGR